MKRRAAFVSCAVVLAALVGGMGVWVSQQMSRNDHNHKLADAALHAAAPQMLTLVQAGADPNIPLGSGPDPTFLAILQQGLHPTPPPDPSMPNAFVSACGFPIQLMEGHQLRKFRCPEDVPLLQAMLAHGANVHWQGRDGQTPLFIAISANYQRAAQLLLDKGANANAPDRNNDTPLIRAALRRERDMVGILLAHGANVNAQNNQGATALHATMTYTRDPDTIRQLMAHGANADLPDKRGQSPLQMAQRMHRPDLIALMQSGGK